MFMAIVRIPSISCSAAVATERVCQCSAVSIWPRTRAPSTPENTAASAKKETTMMIEYVPSSVPRTVFRFIAHLPVKNIHEIRGKSPFHSVCTNGIIKTYQMHLNCTGWVKKCQ